MIKASLEQSSEERQESTQSVIKRSLNLLAVIYISILLICIITWTVLACLALFANVEPMYPKPVIGIPFLILLCSPAIVSLTVILFRTFFTIFYAEDTESFEPLNLIANESQRQLLLLPLSVSGFMMSILPAYYFHHGRHYAILGSQAVIGFLLLFLFLGVSLIPESSPKTVWNHRLFLTIHERKYRK